MCLAACVGSQLPLSLSCAQGATSRGLICLREVLSVCVWCDHSGASFVIISAPGLKSPRARAEIPI